MNNECDNAPSASPELILAPAVKGPDGVTPVLEGPPLRFRESSPDIHRARKFLHDGMVHLAALGAGREEQAAADQCFRRALRCLTSAGHHTHRLVAYAHDRIGFVSHSKGRLDEAERSYLRSLLLARCTGDLPRPWKEVTLTNLGILYRDQGRHAMRDAVVRELRRMRNTSAGSRSFVVGSLLDSDEVNKRFQRLRDHGRRKAATRAAQNLSPFQPWREDLEDWKALRGAGKMPRFRFPDLGTDWSIGWELEDTLICHINPQTKPRRPALTVDRFLDRLRIDRGYAIIKRTKARVYVGVFREEDGEGNGTAARLSRDRGRYLAMASRAESEGDELNARRLRLEAQALRALMD